MIELSDELEFLDLLRNCTYR